MGRDQIYCGNNLYDVGDKRIGTPYECLRKGVGKGLHSDLTGFNPNYRAIIPNNTYCGKGRPPRGKRMGTPLSCLRKGVGVGKRLQYERGGDIIEHFHGGGQRSQQIVPRWWPVIVALLVGVLAAIFRATYATILLTMIAALAVSLLVQSVIG